MSDDADLLLFVLRIFLGIAAALSVQVALDWLLLKLFAPCRSLYQHAADQPRRLIARLLTFNVLTWILLLPFLSFWLGRLYAEDEYARTVLPASAVFFAAKSLAFFLVLRGLDRRLGSGLSAAVRTRASILAGLIWVVGFVGVHILIAPS